MRRAALALVGAHPRVAGHELAGAVQRRAGGLVWVCVVERHASREPTQGGLVGLAPPLGSRRGLAIADLREALDRRLAARRLHHLPQRIDGARARQREAAALLIEALGRDREPVVAVGLGGVGVAERVGPHAGDRGLIRQRRAAAKVHEDLAAAAWAQL